MIVISAGAIPPLVQSYREAQLELQAGNLLVQDQAYTTTPIQTLFHSQTAATTDTEAFAFGRSGIDSTYMNRTSYPGYINPWNVVKLADQYAVMSDSMNMTKTDSWLNPRMWAL